MIMKQKSALCSKVGTNGGKIKEDIWGSGGIIQHIREIHSKFHDPRAWEKVTVSS
jgi:hypothetical protein